MTQISVPPASHKTIRQPPCPSCTKPMMLVQIAPDEKPDHDRRSFACIYCGRQEMEIVKYR